jgi:hypothetical protein
MLEMQEMGEMPEMLEMLEMPEMQETAEMPGKGADDRGAGAKITPAVACSTGFSLWLHLDTDNTAKAALFPEPMLTLL